MAAFEIFGEFFAASIANEEFPDIPAAGWMTAAYFATLAASKYRYLREKYRKLTHESSGGHSDAEEADLKLKGSRRARRRVGVRVFCHEFFLSPSSLILHVTQLYEHRKKTIELQPVQTLFLQLCYHIVSMLGPSGMSSDETEAPTHRSERKQTRRHRLAWINPIITNALFEIDALYTRVKTTGRPLQGKEFRDRLNGHRVDSLRDPVRGLPINFYCPVYIASLHPFQRRALQPGAEQDLNALIHHDGNAAVEEEEHGPAMSP